MIKKMLIFGFIVLLFGLPIIILYPVEGIEENTVIVDLTYNENTPGWGIDHFASIQDAIDSDTVTDGWTVYVNKGIYHENISIYKSINLEGQNTEETIENI